MSALRESSSIELLPAIDLRGGRVVRLRRGDDEQRTTYTEAPGDVLRRYRDAGIARVHVVDLDAAFGEKPQRALIERLIATPEAPSIQLGGGLREEADIEWALSAGVERIVVTSMIVRRWELFREVATRWPRRVVAALDVDGGELRTAGWTESADLPLEEVCRRLQPLPLAAVLVTDISRDGMGSGPNFDLARYLARAVGVPGILSGGVATLGDLRRAATIPELSAVIVGRALYDGQVTLEDALLACRGAEVSQ
ncbi:MAG: 1-(5-phosphoribosyl)-5-[(5-phosphoribosylamino)methylideneamino] imidazole-4-carboxamide isomerase [Acidobacteria bacterium]|nr:MAG: 1-(5-phosphoribosyl)-5-[(5-phosphoribosylamino)methylideneamino] imidazole-4-carboxamide isomerase [Acidobacteriota bacterium]REK07783.1 MAG: 1-(5-phosphoribosyl)-5-[(5-phosphoribosylamino)methylideneamino] imidazole-4-carboxamide isomerase [Acidobacteriota bacterium]